MLAGISICRHRRPLQVVCYRGWGGQWLSGKSDGTGRWRNSRAYDQENNEDDTFMATLYALAISCGSNIVARGPIRFMQENDALLEQLWCSVGEYNRTAGHWTGGNCNPGVSWSRDDFVDQLMLWWPFALIEEVGCGIQWRRIIVLAHR